MVPSNADNTKRVFDYFKLYYTATGEWPSLSKAAIDLGYADSTGVTRQVKNLKKKGLMRKAYARYWYIPDL